MSDEELVKRLRGMDGDSMSIKTLDEAADRIEALTKLLATTKDTLNICRAANADMAESVEGFFQERDELLEQLEAARADAKEAEAYAEELARDLVKADNYINDRDAKLAKAVRGLNAICAWGEDTYARDMARALLAEIEGSNAP